jgi:hypothetical protein
VRARAKGAGGTDLRLGLLQQGALRSAVESETDGTYGTYGTNVTYKIQTGGDPFSGLRAMSTRPSADTPTRSYGCPPKLA